MAITTRFETRFEHSDLYLPREVKIINDTLVAFKDVVVHDFPMGDVEDADLYAAEPLYKWQQSDAGQWVIENAVAVPYWTRQPDVGTYGYRYYVVARLSEQNETFWRLKWGGLSK